MFGFLTSKRFLFQLMLVFFLFTLGSAVLLGIPAAILLERQTNAQLEALVDQTLQTTLALFDNEIIQIQDLAILLAERPTLNQFVRNETDPALSQYLIDFLSQADLDAIVICQNNEMVINAGGGVDQTLCGSVEVIAIQELKSEAWMLSSAPLDSDLPGESEIIVGKRINGILNDLSNQTGMAYILFADTGFFDTTLPEESISSRTIVDLKDDPSQRIEIGSISYIQSEIRMNVLGEYHLFGFLDIDPFLEQTRQFRYYFAAALIGVSLIGAGAAVLVARGISKPLNQLAKSAASLRAGDLSTPLSTPSDVWEVGQLSNALEDARVSLKYSLDQLRQEKQWIENLMNSMVEVLLTTDDNLKITYVSRSIENLTGVDQNFLLGKNLDEIFLPASGESLFSQQLPGQNQSRRIPVLMDDMEMLLSVSTSAVLPAESDNATQALMIRDVTDEERVHHLLGEFMANITHEFRTPLSALAASVELLMDEYPGFSKEEIGHLLEALNLGIIDLQSLIDNLIETASIEAGRFKVNIKNVELSEILVDAIRTMEPLMKKKDLKLQNSKIWPSFLVKVDKRRSVQVLINLFSNAINHSPEKGNISLRTLMMEDEVLIEIQDEGQGVQPEYQDRLFKRFTSHGNTQDLSKVGMGLGLSVVKAVIEAQGGRVGFRNHAEGGAIFWFTMQIVPEEAA